MRSAIRNLALRALAGRALACGALLLAVAAPARAQVPEIPPPADVTRPGTAAESRAVGGLRPGDVIRMVVWKEKDLTGEFLIDSRGVVQIPGIGVLQVAGLEPQQAQQRIVEALKARGFTAPEVALQALVRVSVLGEVRTPALYPTEPGTSLLQIVTLAGGPTERANLRAVRVVRDGRPFTVDLEAGLGGSAAGRIVLYSGDYVVVPRKTGFSRETLSFALSIVGTTAALVGVLITLNR